ncbi:MAG: hypothetical protein RL297_927 [Pseudomonadota bacterium]|jgi:type I restriction enzyme S subunit
MSTEVRDPSAKYLVESPYKHTAIGEIPSDWSITSLREATDAARPISYGIVQTGPDIDGGVPCIRVVDIDNGRLNTTGLICTSEAISAGYRRTLLQAGDLVMPLRGKVGDVAEVGAELEGANLTRGVALLSIRSGIVGSYCRQALAWSSTRRRLEQAMNGSALQEIPIAALRSFQIALPREEREQRAIATALSDVDALIAGLEKLIAKKRDLKQAAMQQLLTGQTRLPGFSGEWTVKQLGEVGEVSSAGVDKKLRLDEEPVRLVNYLDVYRKYFIYSHDLNHWVTAPAHQAQRCAVKKGDVFFTPTSETRNDIGRSAVAMEDIPDAAYSYHVARFRLHEPWDLRFRTYAFKTRAFLNQVEKLCDGNGTRYVISQEKFRSMVVCVPPIDEQAAIASILSEMDTELSTLQNRLAKNRAIKQGMMQELLTGRTRLV